MQLPTEEKLKRYLLRFSEINYLPTWAELEPGSFFYAVKEVWAREQDRDGRRGHMSETAIAEKISELTGRKFTRNQYQTIFGAGRKDQKSKPEIPRDVAEAFLNIAFNNWSFGHTDTENSNGDGFKSIFPSGEVDLKQVIPELCDLIYSSGIPIRCFPPTGLGPRGFYRQCRRDECSVIIATEREHIIMDIPGVGYVDWIENVHTMFENIDWDNSPLMHIWVIREPLISSDPRSVTGLHDIGMLRTAFMVARAMCLSKKRFSSWEQLSNKCIVAMLMDKNNGKYRSGTNNVLTDTGSENPIAEYFIFPKEVPWEWNTKDDQKLLLSDLNFITTARENSEDSIEIKYNIYPHKENHHTPPVISKTSPSRESDRSFAKLYLACKQYVEKKKGGTSCPILDAAINHGWMFMTADEFLDLQVP